MTIEWMLAKYVSDMKRNEPVNVGLILRYGGEVFCRFLGENQSGVIDGRKVASRFESAEAYKLWVDHWRRAARDGSPDLTQRRSGDNYYVEEAGRYLYGEPEMDAEAMLGELFARLVDRDVTAAPDVYRLSESVICRLPMAKEIVRDSEIIVHHGGGEDELRFHYRYNNGRPHLMQRVSLTTDSQRAWDRVHSIAWSFEKILMAQDADLKNSQCIALVKSQLANEGKATRRQLQQLAQLAEIVDVSDTTAANQQLRELLAH